MRKHLIKKYKTIDAEDMSNNIDGEATVCEQVDILEYILSWSGSGLSGEFIIETSQEEKENESSWEALDFGSTIAVPSDTGSHRILITQITFKRVRIRYEASAGTGLLTASLRASTKGA